MKVKRKSWHYWFYKLACSGWPSRKTNLCAYFWKTVFGISIVMLGSALALGLIGIIGLGFYYETALTFMILGAIGALVGFIPLCLYIGDRYQESEPGLVRLYLKAKKDKVCPLIEFEG